MRIMHPTDSNDYSSQKGEIEALLVLLDDNDPVVTTAVKRRFLELGHHAVPLLRRAVTQNQQSSSILSNAQACIRGIQAEALAQLVNAIIDAHRTGGDIELERAAIFLSSFGYPETDPTWCRQRLDELAEFVQMYLEALPYNNHVSVLIALNTVLFEREHFRGAIKNYKWAGNAYLAPVLELREGIPISLAVVYILVAQRIGVELWGVGMPLHFLVYYPHLDVFIDTFNAGTFISHRECQSFIEQSGFAFIPSMLRRRSNIEIIVRMMRNLIYAHTKSGELWEAETLGETLELLDSIIGQH